jgi:predicted dehydrogenase
LEADEPETRLSSSTDDTLRAEISAFELACAGAAEYPVRPEEALRNVAVVEAIANSAAADGAWTDVAQEVI